MISLPELLVRFIAGGTLVVIISILGKSHHPQLAGLAVLFPVVSVVGYYFLISAIGGDRGGANEADRIGISRGLAFNYTPDGAFPGLRVCNSGMAYSIGRNAVSGETVLSYIYSMKSALDRIPSCFIFCPDRGFSLYHSNALSCRSVQRDF